MKKKTALFHLIVSFLMIISTVRVYASNVGETITVEGYVDSAGKNSLYVAEQIFISVIM